VTPAARLVLAERGYDAEFGARPLKRLIQRVIADPAALLLLEGKVTESIGNATIRVDVVGGEFTVKPSVT
jgi:ATP-dependent Clp protease ATP-binding subunit ClpA